MRDSDLARAKVRRGCRSVSRKGRSPPDRISVYIQVLLHPVHGLQRAPALDHP